MSVRAAGAVSAYTYPPWTRVDDWDGTGWEVDLPPAKQLALLVGHLDSLSRDLVGRLERANGAYLTAEAAGLADTEEAAATAAEVAAIWERQLAAGAIAERVELTAQLAGLDAEMAAALVGPAGSGPRPLPGPAATARSGAKRAAREVTIATPDSLWEIGCQGSSSVELVFGG